MSAVRSEGSGGNCSVNLVPTSESLTVKAGNKRERKRAANTMPIKTERKIFDRFFAFPEKRMTLLIVLESGGLVFLAFESPQKYYRIFFGLRKENEVGGRKKVLVLFSCILNGIINLY
jgi:hypothetical protein